jgi:hypothetical protein
LSMSANTVGAPAVEGILVSRSLPPESCQKTDAINIEGNLPWSAWPCAVDRYAIA